MAKKTQLDRAIDSLEADKAVLQLAIDKLKAQRQAESGKRTAAKVATMPEAVGSSR